LLRSDIQPRMAACGGCASFPNISLSWCGGSDIRFIVCATLSCGLLNQSHTGINKLLVSRGIPEFANEDAAQ
jgi:hypothetical protein